MSSVNEPTTPQDTQLESALRSPFQLNKTKGPVKLVPLHAAIQKSSSSSRHAPVTPPTGSASSSTSSIDTVSSGDVVSPKSALGESPFSFSLHKTSLSGLSTSTFSSGSSILTNNFNPDDPKQNELLKEIQRLKRDIEAKNRDIESKEAKLSSSVKSIKQFWSPELKKERAIRKEEEEKVKVVEEKCQTCQHQLKECQDVVQQLESKLNTKDNELKSLTDLNTNQNNQIIDLQSELKKLKRECERIDELNEKLYRLETTNKHSVNEIRDLETTNARLSDDSRRLEETNTRLTEESRKKSSAIRELELLVNDTEKLAEDYTNAESKLQIEYDAHTTTKQLLEKCKEEIRQYRTELLKLKEELSAEDNKKDLARLEEELYAVKESLLEQERLYEIAKDDAESYQHREKGFLEQVEETKYECSEKHKHCEKLEKEITSLTAEKKELQEELECTTRTNQDSEHKFKNLKKEKQDLAKQLDRLKIENDNSEAEKMALVTQIAKLQRKIDEIGNEEQKLVGERARLEGEIGSIRACQEESKRASITTEKRLSKQLEEKECKLEEAWEEKEKYSLENKILITQKTEFEKENKILIARKTEFEKENKILIAQKTELEIEMKEVKEKLDTQIDENLKLRESGNDLSREYLTSKTSVKELEDKYNTADAKNNQLAEKLRTCERQINELEDELHKSKAAGQKTKASVKELEDQYSIVDAKNHTLTERLHHSERQVSDLENKLHQSESELHKSKAAGVSSTMITEDLKLKTTEVQELTTKYNNLNKYVTERETALDNSRDEVAELKEKNQSYATSNITLETEIRLQKNQVEKLERGIDSLKSQISSLEKEKLNLEKVQDEGNPALEQLRVQFDLLKEKHDDQKKLLSLTEDRVHNLERNLREKEQSNKELGESLKEFQEKEKLASESDAQIEKLKEENEELSKETNDLKTKLSSLEKQRNGSVVEEKTLSGKKNLWGDLSKKDARIEELEKIIKEKNRQIAAIKKSKNTEWEKQMMENNKNKRSEDDLEGQLTKVKADSDQKQHRISLLEEALREMVAVAKERENIMARYAEVYEEVEGKYEEADREYSRICFERSITNIKNALLILILCQREALISSMKVSYKTYLDELFSLRQERLITSISEIDTQIANLESQSTNKNKRDEISKMRYEKEKYVTQLKEHNNHCMSLNSMDDKAHGITSELREAPPEQVLEAIRHLSHTNTLLESKVDEFLTFLRDKNADLLKDITDVPMRRVRPLEQLISSPKDDLMTELVDIEDHSVKLQKFVEDLLTMLEGEQT